LLANEWIERNPVAGAARPRRRRQGDANPDLQFLTIEQLDRVLTEIPDDVVTAAPAPTRRGRPGPAPAPPPDVLGPVLRVLILAAAFTGLRQSELIGLRWRDVDLESQRIRVRNAVVRGEHSGEGKSDLSTRRSVPMTERLRTELERWHGSTVFDAANDLVFAHPQLGSPLDRTKVTRRFQAACRRAGVPVIRFHDLRHTFATQLAASGVPLRALQEFLGHADLKTTQIYAHYARSAWELDMVDAAFGSRDRKE
jgi:integrase